MSKIFAIVLKISLHIYNILGLVYDQNQGGKKVNDYLFSEQQNIFVKKGAGGLSKAVQSFSEKSSILAGRCLPNLFKDVTTFFDDTSAHLRC